MPLTPKQLLDAGIKPGELFGRILKGCNTIEEAIAVWQASQPVKAIKGNKINENTAWHFLTTCDVFKGMISLEFPGAVASNSEKKRWLENGAVVINGSKPKPNDIIADLITELVFFPNSDKRRCTMV